MPKAYVVFDLDIHDLDSYTEYENVGRAAVDANDGVILADSGEFVTLAGPDSSRELFLVEFPSYEAALAFYNDPDHQAMMPVRDRSSDSRVYLIKGNPTEA